MTTQEIADIKDELKGLRRRVEWLTYAVLVLALTDGGAALAKFFGALGVLPH